MKSILLLVLLAFLKQFLHFFPSNARLEQSQTMEAARSHEKKQAEVSFFLS